MNMHMAGEVPESAIPVDVVDFMHSSSKLLTIAVLHGVERGGIMYRMSDLLGIPVNLLEYCSQFDKAKYIITNLPATTLGL